MKITLTLGDITLNRVGAEVLVNAANTRMLGGGGVDGAIHRAAGPRLLARHRALPVIGHDPDTNEEMRLNTGEVVVTPAFDLERRGVNWLFHTAGPIYDYYPPNDACRLLSSCYRNCLHEAMRMNVQSIAFPAISTGAYGFPVQKAARVALTTIFATLHMAPRASVQDVYLVFAGENDSEILRTHVAESVNMRQATHRLVVLD